MIKWGIMATGNIANSFAEDFRYVNGGMLRAIASRNHQKAQAFADKHNIRKAFGSYEELAADKETDAIYIATPHSEHYRNTLLLLHNGKHVLCEKPFAVNAAESAEMIALAKSKKLFLMEAMWMVFQPGFLQAKQWIEAGRIGDLTMIRAELGFRADYNPDHRLFNPELAGGALLDIGIYPIAIAQYLFNKKPIEISSIASIGETGVDEQLSLGIKYGENQIAHLSASFLTKLENSAFIYGTHGHIQIPDFWHSKKALLVSKSKAVVFEKDTPVSGYANEVNHMNKMIGSGRTESDVVTFQKTTEIMEIMDAVRAQIGVSYPADEKPF